MIAGAYRLFALLVSGTLAGVAAENGALENATQFEVRVAAVASVKPDLNHVRGTAFLVGSRGLMMTADHVISDESGEVLKDLFVLRPTPPTITASPVEVVKRFGSGKEGRDLALLQIKLADGAPDLPFFEVGSDARVGEEVFLTGWGLVFDKVYRWPLFRFGRVSSTRFFLRESKVLVLDLTSAGGFSGAPVVRLSDGKVLAVQKGGATGNKAADFSLATVLTPADIEGPAPAEKP